jgi:hypothetical protein
LPAIRWKLQNLARLKKSNPGKFTQQAEELQRRLAGPSGQNPYWRAITYAKTLLPVAWWLP